jgi:hypothetical protein
VRLERRIDREERGGGDPEALAEADGVTVQSLQLQPPAGCEVIGQR